MLPSGVLSFPLTAFDADGELDLPAFSAHLDDQVSSGPAAVFVACGTGEVSSLSENEHAEVVRTSVSVAAGRVPVFAGIGGGLATAKAQAGAAAAAGVDGVLLLPPYLVSGPPAGLLAYVRAVAAVSSTPLTVYRRATNLFGVATALALLDVPNVVGIKDGNGDVDTMTHIVTAVRTSGHARAEDFRFLNGLPTAELSAQAYKAIGIPQYSSAIFCCAPDIALGFAAALAAGDDATCQRLLKIFYPPVRRSARHDARLPRLARESRCAHPRVRRRRCPAAVDRPVPGASQCTDIADRRRSCGAGSSMKVTQVVVTPVAFADPPLLNSVGVHEPFAIRAVVQVHTDEGLTGLGETYGDDGHVAMLEAVARELPGTDPFDTTAITRITAQTLGSATVRADLHGLTGAATPPKTLASVVSPFEVAFLDIVGKAVGRPVVDLLGGPVRTEVPFSAYLFYKWGAHPGSDDDAWGAALDADGIVALARRMVELYGFDSLKLKGGVLHADDEADAVEALRVEFPSHPLRIDPNATWDVPTSIRIGQRLDGVLEYLEDPTRGIRRWPRCTATCRCRWRRTCASWPSSTSPSRSGSTPSR